MFCIFAVLYKCKIMSTCSGKDVGDCIDKSYDTGYKNGYEDCKKELLKNSFVCKIEWYDGMWLDYTQEQLEDILLDKLKSNVGDKVRIIILKEQNNG